MIITFIKWAFIFIVIYLVFNIVKGILKLKRVIDRGGFAAKSIDKCPACGQMIQLPASQDLICPKCDTKLARTKDGKLLIRVN
ncbi:hypothetical protein [Chengkuizengella axinellae]|uniref:Uncharacterized protein n=1 Tax=Chengkuizengella axinellae TaxID=3064388 RepID=A0ABT9J4Q2_9BACL|nr:hypothetical protein [Chengkuizengella sp. 2205SS18-9]MDP5276611.1 hypothetical protein [Chengkuizengella sp. 2205SS18-9]